MCMFTGITRGMGHLLIWYKYLPESGAHWGLIEFGKDVMRTGGVMQAPFIPPNNLMLYLILAVWFLCHTCHSQTATESDNGPSGQYSQILNIPNRTSEQTVESVSSTPYKSSRNIESELNNSVTSAGIVIKQDDSPAKYNFKRSRTKFTQSLRQKRTASYRLDLQDRDFVTHWRQLSLAEPDSNLNSMDYNIRLNGPKLQSDYMMRIFECFTNSSCQHPHASMVRSFPNKFNTGKQFVYALLSRMFIYSLFLFLVFRLKDLIWCKAKSSCSCGL